MREIFAGCCCANAANGATSVLAPKAMTSLRRVAHRLELPQL